MPAGFAKIPPGALAVALIAALVGGGVGGGVAVLALRGRVDLREFHADRIVAREILVEGKEPDERVRLAEGSVIAGRTLLGVQVRCVRALSGTFLAGRSPVSGRFEDCEVAAELGAMGSGGVLVVRNPDALLVGSRGPVKTGHATCIAYDEKGLPFMVLHDLARGDAGRAFVYRVQPVPDASGANRPAAPGAGPATGAAGSDPAAGGREAGEGRVIVTPREGPSPR